MKEKEKTFKTASEVVRVLATICRIMLIISAVACVVAAIVFVIVQSKIDFSAVIAELQAELAKDAMVAPASGLLEKYSGLSRVAQVGIVTSVLLAAAALILATSVVFENVAKLFKNFQLEKTPFIPENVALLRKIAIWMFGILGAGCIISIICYIASGYQYEFSINLDSLMVAFIALGLTYVFEYGCKLEEKKSKKH